MRRLKNWIAWHDLVMTRKNGRWAYYRLPDAAAEVVAQPVLDWLHETLKSDAIIRADRKKLTVVTAHAPEDLCRRQRPR
jgi:hypothetical protein